MQTSELIDVAAFETATLETAWDVRGLFPALARELFDKEKWVGEAIAHLQNTIPIPPGFKEMTSQCFFRPPGSYRSFYFCPGLAQGTENTSGAVIALKGMEPLSTDIVELLRALRGPSYSPHNIAEHLLFEENKIPGAVTFPEALREAEASANLQSLHLQNYGTLARLPVPLLVLRHTPDTVRKFSSQLRAELSSAGNERMADLLRDGLGVLIYFYPSPPLRVRDLESMLQGMNRYQRSFALLRLCDPDKVVDRWITCFARMLHFGLLPGALPSLRTGICCQRQNACMDGGFVDVDSVTAFSSFPKGEAAGKALAFSVECLIDTIRALLTGSVDATNVHSPAGDLEFHHFRSFTVDRLNKALIAEAVPGTAPLHPIVRDFFYPPPLASELMLRLNAQAYLPTTALVCFDAEFQSIAHRLLEMATQS